MLSKRDIQKLYPKVTSLRNVQKWHPKVTFKSGVKKWSPKVKTNTLIQKWRPKWQPKVRSKRDIKNYVKKLCVKVGYQGMLCLFSTPPLYTLYKKEGADTRIHTKTNRVFHQNVTILFRPHLFNYFLLVKSRSIL